MFVCVCFNLIRSWRGGGCGSSSSSSSRRNCVIYSSDSSFIFTFYGTLWWRWSSTSTWFPLQLSKKIVKKFKFFFVIPFYPFIFIFHWQWKRWLVYFVNWIGANQLIVRGKLTHGFHIDKTFKVFFKSRRVTQVIQCSAEKMKISFELGYSSMLNYIRPLMCVLPKIAEGGKQSRGCYC